MPAARGDISCALLHSRRNSTVLHTKLSACNHEIGQTKQRKAKGPKLYSWHAPETECLAKGKARTPYEFGVKVGIASTLHHNLILGARSFPTNPYDGHTLNEQLEQAQILSDSTIRNVYVDLGIAGWMLLTPP